jgi:type I restriction enzyme M protein
MNLVEEGINRKLIRFEDDEKYVIYLNENRRRNYANPEEKVQVETYLKLVLIYNYLPNRIRQFVFVTMGSEIKEADIIVFNDEECKSPHIVVECKKEEVSELEFEQATNQGFAYAYALAGTIKYVWVTSRLKDVYFQVDKEKHIKISIPDIPQYGVDKLAQYKYAKSGGVSNKQKLFELQVVTEDELTRRFKQAHQALWGGGELNPSEAFDELDKLIFCKIWDERKARKKGERYDFQIFTESTEEKTNKELLKRIKDLYEEGRKKDPEVFKDGIRLSATKCRTVVGYLESVDLSRTDLDSKGRAFETFMGSFFRGDFGQYFTPRPIVKFIVDVLPIKNDSLVLDTSCGSAGFLLHALDKIRRQASEYYEENTTDYYKYWHDFAEKNLYGIEINEQIARTAKMNMIIHDDGHTNVIAADGLLPDDKLREKTNHQGFKYNHFDFIITNPPFGSIVRQTEQAYLKQYGFAQKSIDWLNSNSKESLRDNQSTEILFIEQDYNFLVEGGYLAIVIPDGILTNSSLQYIRDGIDEKYRIVAVVSMPQTAFQATGAGVKSSVLFLKKHTLETSERIKKLNTELQNDIKQKNNFIKQLQQIENERKQHIKELRGFNNVDGLKGKNLTQSETYNEWKNEINTEYKNRINSLKEILREQYNEERPKMMDDYRIFMAIAEDIGYDATGKPTNNNELDLISKELARFVEAIERGEA